VLLADAAHRMGRKIAGQCARTGKRHGAFCRAGTWTSGEPRRPA
jgi:hypothetical protein